MALFCRKKLKQLSVIPLGESRSLHIAVLLFLFITFKRDLTVLITNLLLGGLSERIYWLINLTIRFS